MVEPVAEAAHLPVQLIFAGVCKGRVADVVPESQSFGQILVQIQRRGRGPGNLRHFDGMSEAVAEMIGNSGRKDLGFVLQPPECARMNDPVSIALEFSAIRMRQFRISPATTFLRGKTQAA
jgi:hypothetical protein